MDAVKCPVCEGKQTVPLGFYETGMLETERQPCRSCGGNGYLYVRGTAVSQDTSRGGFAMPLIPGINTVTAGTPMHLDVVAGEVSGRPTMGRISFETRR